MIVWICVGLFFVLMISAIIWTIYNNGMTNKQFEQLKKIIEEGTVLTSQALAERKKEVAKLCEKNIAEEQAKADLAIKKINEQLDKDLEQAKENSNNRLVEITKELADKTVEITSENASELERKRAQYAALCEQEEAKFTEFLENINEKKEILSKDFEAAKNRQSEIISQFRRSVEMKEQENFYRIVLSEEDKEDVYKLRKMAADLHDPTALYKLIYEQYYKRPFSELMGRIIGEDTSVGIYKITSIETGKCYIGQTKQEFKTRFLQHVKRGLKVEAGTKNKLYNAMWEDGVENFTFEILAHCELEQLNQKEKEFIEFYKANEWGYNSTTGNS